MLRIFTNFLLFFFVSSCTTFVPTLKEGINYQRDVDMEVQYVENGAWKGPLQISGMGVVYKSSHYKIKIKPPGQADMLTVTSCHREIKTPNPKKSGGWFSKKEYEFIVPIQNSVDEEELCSFDIGVYEKSKGRHAWGTLAIMDDEKYNMPALTKCNGRVKQYAGTSVCQAKKGLIQEYIFDQPVTYAKVMGCELVNTATTEKYSKIWKFIMPEGECEIFFIDVKNPMKKVHQAFFFGYDTIPIRGVE